jgi:hypothetical protein
MGSIRPGVKSLKYKQTMEIVFDDYFAKMELHSAEMVNSGSLLNPLKPLAFHQFIRTKSEDL